MVSSSLLVQARRRAGLSQRALAARAGLSQQEIARYERGRVTPSLERLRTLIAACDLELTFALVRADDSYDEQVAAALELEPALRLEHALSDAQILRLARAQASDSPPPGLPDVPGVLAALEHARVHYVLVGELAEVLHGSPLLPLSGSVVIVPRLGQREQLDAAISASEGKPTERHAPSIDAPASFSLGRYDVNLLVMPAPPGSQGYEDLRRDATAVQLSEQLSVTVASIVDLVRIAEASEDRSRVPALRRTLELATTPRGAANANAA